MRATILSLISIFLLLVCFSDGRVIKRRSLNRLANIPNSVSGLTRGFDESSTSGEGQNKKRKRNAAGGNILESLLSPVSNLQNAANPGLLGGGANPNYGTAPNANVQSNGNQGLLGLDKVVGQLLPKPAPQPQNVAPPFYVGAYPPPA